MTDPNLTLEPLDYLSDDALEALIACSEAEGLLSAPRQVKEETLAVLRAAPSNPAQKTPRQRFHAYCIRVGVSVAAALLLLFGTVPLGSLVSRHGAEVSQAAQLQLPMPSLPDLSLPEVTLPDLGERFRSADDHFRSFQSHFSLNHMGENEHESHD